MNNKTMPNSKLLPRWFTLWFYLSCLVLLIGGIADKIAGKYRFTTREALFTGGFSLGLVELFSAGVNIMAFLAVLFLPFVIMIHGVHMIMPKLALSEDLEKFPQKESKYRYLAGVVLPLVGTVIGIGITFLIVSVFKGGNF